MPQTDITYNISRNIQDIIGDPSLSPLERSQAIANLEGASRQDMYDYANANFRTGSDLALKGISEDKQKGMSLKDKVFTSGIKKKSK